jgi:hypothetical protein
VACFPGLGPEKQKHVSASIVAVAAGHIAPGLKTTNWFPGAAGCATKKSLFNGIFFIPFNW